MTVNNNQIGNGKEAEKPAEAVIECPDCGNKKAQVEMTEQGTIIIKCNKCGYGMTKEDVKDFEERIRKYRKKEKKEKESKRFWIGEWFIDLDKNIARSKNRKIMTADEFGEKLCEIILKTFPVSKEKEKTEREDKKYEVECFKCGKKVLITGAELEAMSRGWLYICNDCAKQNPEDDNNKTGLTFRKRRLKKNIARIWCRFCDRTLFAQEWYETENGISCCAECYEMLKGDENERGE